MYTPVSTLHDFQKFLADELEGEHYTLLAEPSAGSYGTNSEKYVVPPVRVAALPHENFAYTPVGELMPSAPYILVSMDNSDTNEDTRTLRILIQCCVYSTQNYKNAGGESGSIPDEQSEIDMLNLLEWIQQKLVKKSKVGGGVIQLPITMGSYGTKSYTYPKAYGYLNFDVELIPSPKNRDWMNKNYKC